MPSTIIKAILALSLPTETPLSMASCGSKGVLRLLIIQTFSTEKASIREIGDARQDLLFGALLILLRSRAVRRHGLGFISANISELRDPSHSTHIAEGAEEQEPVRMEEELKQLKAAGSCRLNTKLTWIVAQKTGLNL